MRRLLGLVSFLAFAAGFGLVFDSVRGDIRTTGDAVFAALRFAVIGVAAQLGQWLARRAGLTQRESSPRTYQAVAWFLVAVTVASAAWLVIDLSAPGWRRLGLILVAVGGTVGTLGAARQGMLSGRYPANTSDPDPQEASQGR